MATETTIRQLLDQYDVLLLDAYGVLVHSRGVLPGAVAFMERLETEQIPFSILTNDASALPEGVSARFAGFGLHIDPKHIVTSGMMIDRYFRDNRLAGADCAVLGTPDSAEYVRRAGGHVVASDAPFDVLVVADEHGFPFLEGVDGALSGVLKKVAQGATVHLLQPNPDLIYPRGNGDFGMAAGGITLFIEAAVKLRCGVDVSFARLGKPHAPIFETAKERHPGARMIMVGDQLETDVLGAVKAGLDSALVISGTSNRALLETSQVKPTWLLNDIC